MRGSEDGEFEVWIARWEARQREPGSQLADLARQLRRIETQLETVADDVRAVKSINIIFLVALIVSALAVFGILTEFNQWVAHLIEIMRQEK